MEVHTTQAQSSSRPEPPRSKAASECAPHCPVGRSPHGRRQPLYPKSSLPQATLPLCGHTSWSRPQRGDSRLGALLLCVWEVARPQGLWAGHSRAGRRTGVSGGKLRPENYPHFPGPPPRTRRQHTQIWVKVTGNLPVTRKDPKPSRAETQTNHKALEHQAKPHVWVLARS